MMPAPRIWNWGDDLVPLNESLDQGGILAIPTESSYGLGVDPLSEEGVAALYRCKGRAPEKALPVVLGDLDQLMLLGGDPHSSDLRELAALWPAPLTVVVPISAPIPASAGLCSLAVRIPGLDRLRGLLLDLGRPLTATSANPSGETPVSEPRRLLEILTGCSGTLVDNGVLPGGPASTIVQIDEQGYRVLRVGALRPEWLSRRVSRPVFSAAAAEIPADDSPNTA
jgi:L-threonylcarbamoyladenylate synthase